MNNVEHMMREVDERERLRRGRTRLTFADLPVGARVRVAVSMEDFYFFRGETGTVIKNKGTYLGVIVRFDKPRLFEDGSVQEWFNFNPHSLALLDPQEEQWDGREQEERMGDV